MRSGGGVGKRGNKVHDKLLNEIGKSSVTIFSLTEN